MGNSSPPRKRQRCETPKLASFTIDIPFHPTYYRGTHNPPGRIQLLPEHAENTAYIIQKIIDPSERKMPGTVQKRPFYVIGWTDPELREARVGVECMRAYKYVSPRQVEEFEYQDLLRREAAEEEEAILKAALVAQQEQAQKVTMGAPKKRGRPAKKKKATGEENNHGVPSLSTPTNNQFSFSADNLQDLQKTMEDRIRSQNNRLALSEEDGGEYEEDEDEDEMLQRVLLQQAERNNRAERLDSDFKISIPSRSAIRPKPESRQPGSRGRRGPGRPPKNSTLIASQAIVPRSGPRKPKSGIKPTRGTKQGGPDRLSGGARTSVECMPAPSLPDSTTVTRPVITAGSSAASVPISSIPSCSGDSVKYASVSQQATLADHKIKPTTPTPLPSYVKTTGDNPNFSASAGKLSLEKPLIAREELGVDAPEEWDILRLEDVKVAENDGERIRYFKVRWKGDWPPDQNPSWEPEECIDPYMVKAFLRLRRENNKDVITEPNRQTLTESPGPAGAKMQVTLSKWLQR